MHFKKFNLHPHVAAGVTPPGTSPRRRSRTRRSRRSWQGGTSWAWPRPAPARPPPLPCRSSTGLYREGARPVRALIVAPTRELAEQIHEAITASGSKTRLRSITVYGGVDINPQIDKLKRGVEIVVACPGRLLDHLGQRTIDLSQVEVLVLDEADQMFDMGFLPDIRRIMKHLPQKRQTLLFSATMPDEIRGLANDVLRSRSRSRWGQQPRRSRSAMPSTRWSSTSRPPCSWNSCSTPTPSRC